MTENLELQLQMNLLKQAGFSPVSHLKRLTSPITTAWGVDWSYSQIGRDFFQNFYDANKANIPAIACSYERQQAVLSAPQPFDLERLYYLGSEKDLSSVGQYGEGFKAAAVSYLRDSNRTIICSSQDVAVVIYSAAQAIPGTSKLHPLIYDFWKIENVDGSTLVLSNCPVELGNVLANSKTAFFYPQNPLLGKPLVSCEKLSIFRSSGSDGGIFYRNLLRGSLPGIPIFFSINYPYVHIEKRIGSDRDRKEFDRSITEFFLSFICKTPLRATYASIPELVEMCSSDWKNGRGNLFLQELSRTVNPQNFVEFRTLFPKNRFFASSKTPSGPDARLQHNSITDRWKGSGLIELPAYFANFGVQTVESHLQEIELLAQQEALKDGKRNPSDAELLALKKLLECLKVISPDLAKAFQQYDIVYSIGNTEVILGYLKDKRSYRSREIFFSQRIFEFPFSKALSIFLHEHCHLYGRDGTRSFSDALTELLEVIVTEHECIPYWKDEWERAIGFLNNLRAPLKSFDETTP